MPELRLLMFPEDYGFALLAREELPRKSDLDFKLDSEKPTKFIDADWGVLVQISSLIYNACVTHIMHRCSSLGSSGFRWLRSTDDSEAVETQEYWNVDPLHEMVSISGPSE